MSNGFFGRALGRALIGVTLADLGRGAVTDPGGRVALAAPTIAQIRKIAPIPVDDATVVRINGGLQVASGAMLALGIAPRLASAGMLASLIPTTQAGHAFWKNSDPAKRAGDKLQFEKNLVMIGGLVYILAGR